MENNSYRLPFEIECAKRHDHIEFCRVFFKHGPRFPRNLLFGMDGVHFSTYKQFLKDNAGLLVNRHDKLTIYVNNKRTGKSTGLAVDLEPYWPADLGPGEIMASLAEINITAAIVGLI